MQHLTSTGGDACHNGVPTVPMPNAYLSAPADRGQHRTEGNNCQYQSGVTQQTFFGNNLSSPLSIQHPISQIQVGRPEQNQLLDNNDLHIPKVEGHALSVNVMEGEQLLSRILLQLRVVTPNSTNHGIRENLQLLLTGHHISAEYGGRILGSGSNSARHSSNQDSTEIFYSVSFTEEDYRHFRQQQGLLVELKAFPPYLEHLVDMVRRYGEVTPGGNRTDEGNGKDRFFAELRSSGGSSSFSKQLVLESDCVVLDFVEITGYKRLVHLSLRLNRGTDKQICQHLASELGIARSEHTQITNAFVRCQEDLKQTNECFERLKLEDKEQRIVQTEKETIMNKKLEEAIERERQRVSIEITEANNTLKNERKKLTDDHSAAMRLLQNQIATLEYENKNLNEKRHRNECTIQGLREDTKRLQIDLQSTREELQKQQREKERVGGNERELDAALHRMKGEIDTLKQERTNMAQEMRQQSNHLKMTLEEKAMLEKETNDKAQLVIRRETAVKTVTQELMKANDAIKKLQNENRNQNGKVKMANQILNQQDKLIEKKDAELEEVRNQLKEENEANRTWKSTRDQFIKEAEDDKAEIDRLRISSKRSESVIQWLNKQLTIVKVRDPGFRMAPPPKNISLGMGDTLTPTMTTLQPSMATEQKNNVLVASTPIQNQSHEKQGKENTSNAKYSDKSQLDPKYLQPSRNRLGSSTTSDNEVVRKSSLATKKQQSVYFS